MATTVTTSVSGVQYSGIWTMQQVNAAVAAGTWPHIPGAPVIGTATATGTTTASVTFTAPSDVGIPALTGYRVTSSPGGFTNTGASSPIVVSGLSPSTVYTFTVQATNVIGYGAASAASNSITTLANLALYSWGYGDAGQLGNGSTANTSSPAQVGALANWAVLPAQGLSQGNRFTVQVKNNGTMWSWGGGGDGNLGLGNVTSYSSPKQIGALTNWLKVSAGYASGAVKTNGTLWMWGSGSEGQLGLGDTTNRSSPTQVGALTDWAYIDSNFRFTMAVKTDGTLWSWGRNNDGQLGLGNTTFYSSPKQVGLLTNWLLVVAAGGYGAGQSSVRAIKTDGTLWAWGGNNSGRLGLGDTTNRSSPVQVGALTDWLKVSAGYGVNIAVKTNGTLWTWGFGGQGALGLGNTTSYSSPKQVGLLTNWTKGTSGGGFQLAIKGGTLWSWGQAGAGSLGLGNTTYYSSPKQVGALTTWSDVQTNNSAVMALVVA